MPASSRSSPRKQPPEGSSSLVPARVVNPSRHADEDVYDAAPDPSGRRPTDTERIAMFLEALAGAIRDDVQQRGPTSTAHGGPNSSAMGLGAPQPAGGYDYQQQDSGMNSMASALVYHGLRALRNIGHFIIIAPAPRGWIIISHISKKAVVIVLFALFLMFASIYRLPEVWEILFGIFGIF